MIDLPDYGYVSRTIVPIDPGGVAEGSLGGASDFIDRPGYRYSVQFELPPMPATEAQTFEAMLEQASREDASYPWPLDRKSPVSGTPAISGSNPVGGNVTIGGLVPGFQFFAGQSFAVVIADGTGFVHKAASAVTANGSGLATVPVFPLTRTTFANGSVVEIERPRIRGLLSRQGSTQNAWGARSFSFTITERR